jgi:hypothetical protein
MKTPTKPKKNETTNAGAGRTGRAKEGAQKAAFEAMIAQHSPEVQVLAKAARDAILHAMPDVVESVWEKQGTASYGTGPKKMSEHFTYFTFAKKHLTFGFYYGADLPDPFGLLEGSGKTMRSVKIALEEQLESAAFRALLTRATAHRVPPLSA